MAVNFGNTIMEGDIAPSVRVQNPVQDDSGAVLGKALAPAAAAIGEIAGSIWKGQQDDANNRFLSGFETKLLDYATAVDQGELTQREAMLLARTEYQQMITSAPALRDDLNKIWSSSFQSSGTLGHVLVSGSEEENMYKKIQEAAITAGYNSVEEYQQNQRLGIYAADVKRQHDVQLAQNGIVTESMKSQGLVAGAAYAQSLFPAVQKTLNDARAQIEANPSQKAEILADVLSRVNSDIALVKSEALGANLEFITSPVEELLKTFESSVIGSTEIATYEANEKLVQFRYETMLKTANPEIAEWAARSKFLESLGISENARVSNFLSEGVLQFLESTVNGDKNANFLSNSADSQAAAIVMDDLLSNVNGSSPEAVEEAKKSIGGLLDGSFVNERAAKDGAMGWKNLVEVLGGSGLASFVEKYGDDIPSEHRAEIAGLLGKYYDSELTDAISQYWGTHIVGVAMVGAPFGVQATPNRMREEKVNNIAQPVWNGNAVEFVPKPGFENDANALAIINGLNVGQNSIGEPLNTLIRAHAFVTKTDPKQVWEQNFANTVFNQEPESISDRVNNALDRTGDPSYTPEDDTELTLSDFNTRPIETNLDIAGIDTESFRPLTSDTFIEPTSNPSVNKEVLDRFAGRRLPVSIRNNNMGAVSITGNIDSSWAAKQPGFVGVTARPANEGGYYAKYATPEHGVAAASKLLELYGRQGVDSPGAIVRKWSADRAAHASYANTLVKYLKEAGFDASPNTRIDLSDPKVRLAVLKAKSSHEAGAGRPVYTDQTFLRGVTYQL